jgi:O-antigen ligase
MVIILSLSFVVLHVDLSFLTTNVSSNSLACALVSIVAISTTSYNRNSSISIYDLVVEMLLVSILVSAIFIPIHIQNVLHLTTGLLVFIIIRRDRMIRFIVKKHLYKIACVVVCLEIFYCFAQYFGWIINPNSLYPVGGVIGHPAFTCTSLVLISPFLISYAFDTNRPPAIRGLVYVILSALVFMIVYLECRAAMISTLLTFILYTRTKYVPILKKQAVIISGSLLVSFLLVFLFYYKYDSSSGRLFIWRNCYQLIEENFWRGIGNSRFEVAYNQVQHNYFALHSSRAAFFERADYVQIAYNDFIEIFVESGVFSFILLGLVIVLLLWRKTTSARDFYIALMSFLPVMLTWSTLKYLSFLIPLFCTLAVLSSAGPWVTMRLNKAVTLLLGARTIILSVLVLNFSFKLDQSHSHYRLALASSSENYFKKAYRHLYYDHRFLLDYASLLKKNKEYEASLAILREANKWSYSPAVHIQMGELYELKEDTLNARRCFERAHYTTPVKVYPKFLLAKHYLRRGDIKKGKQLADEIIRNPHLYSVDMLLIKERLIYLLRKNENNTIPQ